jgi:uncharacterized protein (DUF2336 family)
VRSAEDHCEDRQAVRADTHSAEPVQATLIDELENALAQSEIGRMADVLRRVTDLFVANANYLADNQIPLFDDVMGRLVEQIDVDARAAFGQRMASLSAAPPNVVRRLALDDSIEVAEPILSRFGPLDDQVLVESARTKSQDHMLAISRRPSLAEAVTDVLVSRGNREVTASVAENLGAKFSEFGYATLVKRAEADTELALRVWCRPEIPRVHLLQLFGAASEAVQQELQRANPRKAEHVRSMIARARDELQTRARESSPEFLAARASVESLRQAGQLSEAQLSEFARARKFDETSVALSLLADLPVGLVERSVMNERPDQILVVAKAIGLSWDTVEAILRVPTDGRPARDTNGPHASFNKLRPETARKAMQYYRLREKAAKGAAR